MEVIGSSIWWSSVPRIIAIKEQFINCNILIIQYERGYPRVQVLIDAFILGEYQLWNWDLWHGGGFWHRID